jgi:SAM-dependent methyltransferase
MNHKAANSNNDLDLEHLRQYYEGQGLAIRNAGETIKCSEKPNVDIVVQMATEYADCFQTVLDVGCGANLAYDAAIASLGKHVVGVDFAANFLKLVPKDLRVTLVQGDATKLPFSNAVFDAVICSETAEHIPNDLEVIQELGRVVRPRGWLFFTVPNFWNAARVIDMAKRFTLQVELMHGHLREYSPKAVSRLLVGNFEIEKKYSVGFGWEGSPFGGRVERLVKNGPLSRFSKSIAVVARKI